MKSRQYFGTDGIRGEFGQFPIVPEFIEACGWAVGMVLAQKDQRKVLLGHDGRASHEILCKAVVAGLNAAGVHVHYCGLCPTPAIAQLTVYHQAQAGMMISASHNPAKDNGIKFFNELGGKLSLAQELAIEAKIRDYSAARSKSVATQLMTLEQPTLPYQELCKRSVDGLNLQGWTLVVDAANGAMSEVAPCVLRALGATVESLFCGPNGNNINAGCGATNVNALREVMLHGDADMGIAFDGDGDRLMLVDSQGNIIDGDGILYLIASHAKREQMLQGGVVGTVMTNMGLEQAFMASSIPFVRTKVGDAYVLAECHARQWQLGGEPSGHVICLAQTSTGDGLIAALQVLLGLPNKDDLVKQLQRFKPYPQLLRNVKIAEPQHVAASPVLLDAIAQHEQQLADGKGRILVRSSGTEPLLRIMVESSDPKLNEQIAASLVKTAEQLAQNL